MNYRFMRLMVFYDLPFDTKNNIRDYNRFRNNLLSEGFQMMQFSIYTKMCSNDDSARYAAKRIEKILPSFGNIRVLVITEKQYQKINILRGKKSKQELLIDLRRFLEL